MKQQLMKIQSEFPEKVQSALYQEAQIELTESKRRVPVDTGKLRSSGFVNEPEHHGREVTVTLGYDTEYAVYVHEDLEAVHPVGEAKFLESVLNESAPFMGQRVAKRLML